MCHLQVAMLHLQQLHSSSCEMVQLYGMPMG